MRAPLPVSDRACLPFQFRFVGFAFVPPAQLNTRKKSSVTHAPRRAPATTSMGLWIPDDHLFQLTMDASRKVRTTTESESDRNSEAHQIEKEMAAWPLGMPPLSGSPLPTMAFRMMTRMITTARETKAMTSFGAFARRHCLPAIVFLSAG